MEEIWKDIKGFEKSYEVSSLGNVRNKRNGKLLSNKRGVYPLVDLCEKPKRKNIQVHRLVAIHFIPNPNNYKEVNHINGNKHDNRIENLEWVSAKTNQKHRRNVLCKGNFPIVVVQLDKDKNVVAIYQSIRSASKQFGNVSCVASLISQAIQSGKTAKGYYWQKLNKEQMYL